MVSFEGKEAIFVYEKNNGYENTFFIDQLFNASCHYGSM